MLRTTRREQDADRGRREQVEHRSQQEERDRARDRNAEPALYHDPQRQRRRDEDHEAVRPDLGRHDLEGRERHDHQVLERSVLAFADQGGPGQDDRDQGDLVQHLHHAAEPHPVEVRVEHHARDELDRRLVGLAALPHELLELAVNDALDVARADVGARSPASACVLPFAGMLAGCGFAVSIGEDTRAFHGIACAP
jgi:hypothetical protein